MRSGVTFLRTGGSPFAAIAEYDRGFVGEYTSGLTVLDFSNSFTASAISRKILARSRME